jgi:putative ABC transport system substrate-binding protein
VRAVQKGPAEERGVSHVHLSGSRKQARHVSPQKLDAITRGMAAHTKQTAPAIWMPAGEHYRGGTATSRLASCSGASWAIAPIFLAIPRCRGLCEHILKGAKRGELPAQQPTKYQFIINLKTANALDFTIPVSLLARVDQVIE